MILNSVVEGVAAVAPSLRPLAEKTGLSVGTALDKAALWGKDARYPEMAKRLFNACVAENAFKPSEVWLGPRVYDFSVTDRLVDFAEENGMLLRGHTLVWHQQTPLWLKESAVPAGALRELLREYIHAIVGRYKGRIAHWDVVNEAVCDPDADRVVSGLRTTSVWHQAFGAEYLRWAFEWAHEADPKARLYYNDYEIEAVGPKSDAVYGLLAGLIADGVPVHGVGFQGHLLNGWRLTEAHRENVRRFTELGLEWAITEADIRMQLEGKPPTGEQLTTQAAGYADLTQWCLSEGDCRALIFWGFTDAYSWIPGFRKGWGAALPLDEMYQPKPAYNAVMEVLARGQ